ncbi:MAG: DUF2834 domain-containing protein [Myxococcales bacterium]
MRKCDFRSGQQYLHLMMKTLWATLAVVGAVVPWTLTYLFFQQYGWHFELIFVQAFSTLGGTFLSLDLLLAASAFCLYMVTEQRKRPVKHFWVPLVGLFAFGTCFAVPAWLYLRE